MMFNRDAYNELPQQYKDLIGEYKGSDMGYKAQIAAYQRTEEQLPQEFVEHGLTKVVIGKEERAQLAKIGGKPIWDSWAEEMSNEYGYDGQALLNLLLTSAEKYAAEKHASE